MYFTLLSISINDLLYLCLKILNTCVNDVVKTQKVIFAGHEFNFTFLNQILFLLN